MKANKGQFDEVLRRMLQKPPEVRSLLDQRYDDVKNGRAKTIDGKEAFAGLRRNSSRRRS